MLLLAVPGTGQLVLLISGNAEIAEVAMRVGGTLLNLCADAGALGERRELARNPLEETARFTQQTIDNIKESSEAPGGVISRLQEFGKKLASQLFD